MAEPRTVPVSPNVEWAKIRFVRGERFGGWADTFDALYPNSLFAEVLHPRA